jgi:hypothetical protein
MRTSRVIPAAVLFTLAAAAPVAFAETTRCTGTFGRVTLDNVVVPDGRTCVLKGTRVEGNIVVGTDAKLKAVAVRVKGNVQAEGARMVKVGSSSFVGGSVQIVQGGGAVIHRVVIDSDLQFFENGGPLQATGNRIGGNLQAVENTGGLIIGRNVIEGALQCKQNDPAPVGGGNQAGDKEDQCEGL